MVDTATGRHTLPAQINSVSGNPSRDNKIVTIHLNGLAYRIRVDTGVRITLISEPDWEVLRVKTKAHLEPCEIRLSPYGSTKHPTSPIPILGKTRVEIKAAGGARIDTEVIVVKGKSEPLLGSEDAQRLGIVEIHKNGATEARPLENQPNGSILRNAETTVDIGIKDVPVTEGVKRILASHPKVFDGLGRMKDEHGNQVEIEFRLKEGAQPVRQKLRPVPIALRPKLEEWVEQGLKLSLIHI